MTADDDANPPDEHEAFQVDFTDYRDKTLAAPRVRELETHLATCALCRGELLKFDEAISALSGLHKMAAPQKFEEQVAGTIYRRSAGRFFGRKAFGDRVPFELIAVVGLIVALGVAVVLKLSLSGPIGDSLRQNETGADAGARSKEVMP